MRIFEVANSATATPSPDQLMGLVSFLAGRADDTNARKEINQDAFISLAQSLDINVTKENLGDLIAQPPLSNMLEPLDPNSGVITFKGGEETDPAMPVNRAQDIVAAAAKSAMKRPM
jgi:hypothetical protein